MKINTARVILFGIWFVIFVSYVVLFMLVGRFNPQVDPKQAREASWRVSYILAPVLTAFFSFWFIPSFHQYQLSDDHVLITKTQFWVATLATLGFHSVIFLNLIINVVMREFAFSPDRGESFSEIVDDSLKLMLFLSSIAVMPVGFLLGRDVAMGNVPGDSAQSTKQKKTSKS